MTAREEKIRRLIDEFNATVPGVTAKLLLTGCDGNKNTFYVKFTYAERGYDRNVTFYDFDSFARWTSSTKQGLPTFEIRRYCSGYVVTRYDPDRYWPYYMGHVYKNDCRWWTDSLYAKNYALPSAKKHLSALYAGAFNLLNGDGKPWYAMQ